MSPFPKGGVSGGLATILGSPFYRVKVQFQAAAKDTSMQTGYQVGLVGLVLWAGGPDRYSSPSASPQGRF